MAVALAGGRKGSICRYSTRSRAAYSSSRSCRQPLRARQGRAGTAAALCDTERHAVASAWRAAQHAQQEQPQAAARPRPPPSSSRGVGQPVGLVLDDDKQRGGGHLQRGGAVPAGPARRPAAGQRAAGKTLACVGSTQRHALAAVSAAPALRSLVRVRPRQARHVLPAHWLDGVRQSGKLLLAVTLLARHHGAGRLVGRGPGRRSGLDA